MEGETRERERRWKGGREGRERRESEWKRVKMEVGKKREGGKEGSQGEIGGWRRER